MNNERKQRQVVSYLMLRKSIGIIGVLFPIVLFIGNYILMEVKAGYSCDIVFDSISTYYHSSMRNIFVAVLCLISFFFFAYKGYDKHDARTGNIASVLAFLVAMCPTDVKCCQDCCIAVPDINPWVNLGHLFSAGALFIVLAYFCLFRFVKTDGEEQMTPEKKRRNSIYRACGVTMLVCIATIAVYKMGFGEPCSGFAELKPVFWLETVALWAFGVSWLVKGKVILGDKK